jgi:hypothetical protein
VRKTIQEIGGVMPENLPTAENVNKLQRKLENDETVLKPSSKKKL